MLGRHPQKALQKVHGGLYMRESGHAHLDKARQLREEGLIVDGVALPILPSSLGCPRICKHHTIRVARNTRILAKRTYEYQRVSESRVSMMHPASDRMQAIHQVSMQQSLLAMLLARFISL